MKAIVVNGASSAGSTSLVRRFCEQARGAYTGLYIDEFTFSLPKDMWERCSRTDQGWVEIGMAFNRHIASAASGHGGVIADTFYKLPDARNHLFDLMGRENVFYVQLYCDPRTLEKREKARGDRRAGLAKSQFEAVYFFTGYDLKIDSGKMDIDTCTSFLMREIFSQDKPFSGRGVSRQGSR